MKKNTMILLGIAYIVFAFAVYYIQLPPLNWHSPAFWSYATLMIAVLAVPAIIMTVLPNVKTNHTNLGFILNSKVKKVSGCFAIALAICVLFPICSGFISSRFLNASEYASRIDVEVTDFDTISEVDFTKTPIIDRTTTEALGDRVMGQMSDLVSQFNVSDEYTQISYLDSVYRVTPLEYADVFKWLVNRDSGVPAYISVDSTDGTTTLVRLEDLGLDNMKYVPSGLFNDNLYRHLRFSYPTEIFNEPSFEIDEDGKPWYVCTTYTYKGVGVKQSVTGAIIVDPITGESTKYELDNLPDWADRVYPESLIIEEIDDYGSLQDGFINSVIGQQQVIVSSDGYSYIEKDGDIWLYTGITSVTSDESNLGFILVNMRTHEALRISAPGANETSAMQSAEDEVKNYGYEATFPILVNVNGNPTYLMSLRAPTDSDTNSVIKQYAMVDVSDYQIVVTVSVDTGLDALKDLMIVAQGSEVEQTVGDITSTITIASIEKIYVDGNTNYYFVDTEGIKYKMVFATKYEDVLAFIQVGDTVIITYTEEGTLITISTIENA